jgi:transposase
MWAKENCRCYNRSGLCYETDLSDAEWAEIAPLIPPAKPGGNRCSVNLREVVNRLMYILGTGCQWCAIPKGLAPCSTVYDYFERWSWVGTLEHIHHSLYVKRLDEASREASPTEAIIDAQNVERQKRTVPHRSTWLRCGQESTPKITASRQHSRRDGIIPLWMEGVTLILSVCPRTN